MKIKIFFLLLLTTFTMQTMERPKSSIKDFLTFAYNINNRAFNEVTFPITLISAFVAPVVIKDLNWINDFKIFLLSATFLHCCFSVPYKAYQIYNQPVTTYQDLTL